MFATHLGGGLYLDSDGSIVHGVAPNTQVYPPPDHFHFNAEKVAHTLKEFSELFPHSEEDAKAWAKFGVRGDLVRSLAKFGKYSSIVAGIATGIAILGIVGEMLKLLSGSDELSPELKKELDIINTQLEGMDESERVDDILALHARIGAPVKLVRQRLQTLLVHSPKGEARRQLYEELRGFLDQLVDPIAELETKPWLVPRKSEKYKASVFLAPELYFSTPNGEVPVSGHPRHATHFDYRLGIPMLFYGTATFLGLLRIAIPWFRSAGTHADTLRRLADAIDNFVVRMQTECLTRTLHTAASVFASRYSLLGPYPVPRDFDHNHVSQRYSYPVGAFDLVRYSDAFLIEQYALREPFGFDRGRRACFNYTWYPASDDDGLDSIAAQANAQAEVDYNALLVASGAFELIKTANSLRHQSTPPLYSETVRGKVIDSRTLSSEAATTARSPDFPLADVIEHPATLRRYVARSRARIATQEPGYMPPFQYRIVLRTLASRVGKDGWGGRDYNGWAWQAGYEDSSAGPKSKRMWSRLNKSLVLSEHELYRGTSPLEPVSRPAGATSGRARMRASTFDWYVPNFTPDTPFVQTAEPHPQVVAITPETRIPKSAGLMPAEHGLGAVSIHLASVFGHDGQAQTFGLSGAGLAGRVDDFFTSGALTGPSPDTMNAAERRHVREEDVDIDWSLTWQDGHLNVQLTGRPEQRSFQAFLVVEETVYSGEPMPEEDAPIDVDAALLRAEVHTAFASEIVNQLVFVPHLFFVRERKELEETKEHWKQIMQAKLETMRHEPNGVSYEMMRLLEDADRQVRRSPDTATLVDSYRRRFEFAAREWPHLVTDVARENERSVRPPGYKSRMRVRRLEALVHRVLQHPGTEEQSATVKDLDDPKVPAK